MTRWRKGTLSDEDRSLWDEVKKTAIPLRPDTKPRLSKDASPTLSKAIERTPTAPPLKQQIREFTLGAKAKKPLPRNNLMPSISNQIMQAPLQMDRKKYGKMRRGKLAPEARIDLHGMTLAQAQPALTNFIASSHARGLRLVLVITGKGKDRDQGGPIPTRVGVLKHQTPDWLRSGPLRLMVMQVTEAHLSHGGSGAYYVYLRRSG
ncbi:Smr/MutS family protein [Pacificibacter marinus]|uniref:Putative DNA endonuclease SmrA n=1 Tax=Pacificibacter marinus TaxID=658057 RepID=A0A1Y5T1U6_9RHOB|nr:Smr/MutS family protein [Pacificibacter marinus]SEL03863.1 DNA-nicking endonuclease, Smr domain [Pacificibacter marinus]SLN51914.1 putative DNA endonuclease SmrA [Pacificibacter marinus]